MSKPDHDLVVVGSGPGGYVAAIRAAQLGFKAAVIEREHVGGICLNWGCIPTKALLKASEIAHTLDHLEEFGFTAEKIGFDAGKVVERSRKVAKQLSDGVNHLLKKNKVTLIEGHARLDGPGKLKIESMNGGKTSRLTADHIILATGARARSVKGLAPDGDRLWSYREAMVPTEIPRRLMVIGSGAIGTEFASFYKDMGAEVTLIEAMDRILPVEDDEISAFAEKQFTRQGMRILKGARVTGMETLKTRVKARVEVGAKTEVIEADRAIIAIGITGNIEDIGLDSVEVETDRGHIVVDEWLRTKTPGLYAIGDVVGAPWLAHKASHEGILCVEKIAGLDGLHPLDISAVPGCTYCRPQIASIGLTERAVKEQKIEARIGKFPLIGNGKAIALGAPDGFVKTIFDKQTGALLGAHLIGPEVTELIQGYAIARQLESTEAELIHTIFPHPTVSEAMHESVLDAYGRVLHI